MNPYYVAYACAHGRDVDSMLVHDVKRFPGGRMAGFIVWIEQQWRAFAAVRAASGRKLDDNVKTEADRVEFGAWLDAAELSE